MGKGKRGEKVYRKEKEWRKQKKGERKRIEGKKKERVENKNKKTCRNKKNKKKEWRKLSEGKKEGKKRKVSFRALWGETMYPVLVKTWKFISESRQRTRVDVKGFHIKSLVDYNIFTGPKGNDIQITKINIFK